MLCGLLCGWMLGVGLSAVAQAKPVAEVKTPSAEVKPGMVSVQIPSHGSLMNGMVYTAAGGCAPGGGVAAWISGERAEPGFGAGHAAGRMGRGVFPLSRVVGIAGVLLVYEWD